VRKLKGLPSGGGLKGLGPKNTRLPVIPLYSGVLGEKDTDPLVMQIWQTMGGRERDYKMAQQIATLQTTKLPDATTPELIVYLWLQQRGYEFEFQVQVNGGRRDVGGSVIDFVVRAGKDWALRIQGSFWHTGYEKEASDNLRKQQIIGSYAGKYQIDGVVDVQEEDLYKDRETVLTLALSGYQLPR
jgi:hypothetical protein